MHAVLGLLSEFRKDRDPFRENPVFRREARPKHRIIGLNDGIGVQDALFVEPALDPLERWIIGGINLPAPGDRQLD